MPSHYDRDALLTAAMRNAQATQDQLGLDERYDRAAVLRDDPYGEPTFRNAGVVSPLSVIATTANRATGRKQMREVGPLRKANRATMGDSQGALDQGVLSRTLAKEDRDVTTAQEATAQQAHDINMDKVEEKRLTDTLALDTKKFELDRDKITQKGTEYSAPEGSGLPPITVVETPQGVFEVGVDKDGKQAFLPLPEGYTPTDTSYGGRYKSLSSPQAEKLANRTTEFMDIKRAVGSWKPKYAQITGLPSSFINNIVAWGAQEDIFTYVNEDMDQDVKEASRWWGQWHRAYTLLKRHEFFGATLTNNEMRSWDESVRLLEGMSPDDADATIKQLFDEVNKAYTLDFNTQYARTGNRMAADDRAVMDELLRANGGVYTKEKGLHYPAEEAQAAADVEKQRIHGEELKNYIPPVGLAEMYSNLTAKDLKDINALPEELRNMALQEMVDTMAEQLANPQALPLTRGKRSSVQ